MAAPKNSTTTKSGRFYTWRDHNFWSVTTILNALPKEALINWAKKYTAEYAVVNLETLAKLVEDDPQGAVDWLKGSSYRSRDKAGDIGTEVHDAIETYILGGPTPIWPLTIKPRMLQFERFLADWKPEFQLAEATAYNRGEDYAGTFDSIARLKNGATVLMDVKTRAGTNYPLSGQKDSGVYDVDALQLSAYRHGEFLGLPNGEEFPMPQVDACCVLRLTNKEYELVEVDAGAETFKNFLRIRDVHAHWLNDYCKHVVLGTFPVTLEGAYPAQTTLEEVA